MKLFRKLCCLVGKHYWQIYDHGFVGRDYYSKWFCYDCRVTKEEFLSDALEDEG